MCKTFEAIHKISEKLEKEGKGKTIKVMLGHFKVWGDIHRKNGHKCCEGVLTIENAKVKCESHPDEIKEFDWLNIPTHQIVAFTFDPK